MLMFNIHVGLDGVKPRLSMCVSLGLSIKVVRSAGSFSESLQVICADPSDTVIKYHPSAHTCSVCVCVFSFLLPNMTAATNDAWESYKAAAPSWAAVCLCVCVWDHLFLFGSHYLIPSRFDRASYRLFPAPANTSVVSWVSFEAWW